MLAGGRAKKTSSSSSSTRDVSSDDYTKVYRLPSIVAIGMFSRFKIIQTGLTILILIPLSKMYLAGTIGGTVLGSAVGIMSFACVMLYIFSGLARRVVGMISVNQSFTVAKVSHLTFWGKKADTFIDIKHIEHVSDYQNTNDLFVRLKTHTGDKNMFLSLKLGEIYHKGKLENVIGTF